MPSPGRPDFGCPNPSNMADSVFSGEVSTAPRGRRARRREARGRIDGGVSGAMLAKMDLEPPAGGRSRRTTGAGVFAPPKDPTWPFRGGTAVDARKSKDARMIFRANVIGLHFAMSLFHLVSGIGQLVYLLASDPPFRVLVTHSIYEFIDYAEGTNNYPFTVGTYNPAGMVIAFTFATCASHLVQALVAYADSSGYSVCLFNEMYHRVNRLRWYEYSATASVMTWVIAQLSGVTDVHVLFLLVVMNVITQLGGGLLVELLWRDKIRFKSTIVTGNAAELDNHNRFIAWGSILSIAAFLASWLVISCHFFANVSRASDSPAWIAVIVPVLFAFYVLFAVYLFVGLRYVKNPTTYEVGWVVLSLLSKTFLAWFLLIGSIERV